MVVVKVRETYDLHTIRNKMSVIAIHTPDPDIIKRNWSGLLMNCKFYRPLSADVTIACASMQSADPLQVGTVEGEIAPEDLFNPILYKAVTNESFSLLEARVLAMNNEVTSVETAGNTARIDSDGATPFEDDFSTYYGLLSDAHGWRHANPQVGLSMTGLRPLVHEVLTNFGMANMVNATNTLESLRVPQNTVSGGGTQTVAPRFMRGNAKPMPRIPCTSFAAANTSVAAGFAIPENISVNNQTIVNSLRTVVAAICIPPSRLHELYYRMVVEWSIEFSEIRTLSEIAGWAALSNLGDATHFSDYSFGESKVVDNVQSMAAANVELDKVM